MFSRRVSLCAGSSRWPVACSRVLSHVFQVLKSPPPGRKAPERGSTAALVRASYRGRLNRMKRLALLFFMGSLAFEGAAQGATYYTSRSGSDGNSCATAQSTSSPKATVNGGISCLSAGDTLLVRGGTYDEQIASVPSGTSWNSVVRIAAYPGETVWVKPTANRIGVT